MRITRFRLIKPLRVKRICGPHEGKEGRREVLLLPSGTIIRNLRYFPAEEEEEEEKLSLESIGKSLEDLPSGTCPEEDREQISPEVYSLEWFDDELYCWKSGESNDFPRLKPWHPYE